MKLRDRRAFDKPEIMIIPMIDIMFFLLVFFMISTMSMVDLKTMEVNLPKAASVETNLTTTYLVTVKSDGRIYLQDEEIPKDVLISRAKTMQKQNAKFAIAVRADGDVSYADLISLLDDFKAAGISRFALAADKK